VKKHLEPPVRQVKFNPYIPFGSSLQLIIKDILSSSFAVSVRDSVVDTVKENWVIPCRPLKKQKTQIYRKIHVISLTGLRQRLV